MFKFTFWIKMINKLIPLGYIGYFEKFITQNTIMLSQPKLMLLVGELLKKNWNIIVFISTRHSNFKMYSYRNGFSLRLLNSEPKKWLRFNLWNVLLTENCNSKYKPFIYLEVSYEKSSVFMMKVKQVNVANPNFFSTK